MREQLIVAAVSLDRRCHISEVLFRSVHFRCSRSLKSCPSTCKLWVLVAACEAGTVCPKFRIYELSDMRPILQPKARSCSILTRRGVEV